MNKERILALADLIESQPEHRFDMNSSDNPACGSAACIGGWADWMRMKVHKASIRANPVYVDFTAAANWLKMEENGREFQMLCFPEEIGGPNYRDISKAAAVRALRKLAETGEVDWDWAIAEGGQVLIT